MAKKIKYGLIDILLEKYQCNISFYELSKATSLSEQALGYSNTIDLKKWEFGTIVLLGDFFHKDIGSFVTDIFSINEKFLDSLQLMKDKVDKLYTESCSYQELNQLLSRLIEDISENISEVERKAFMYQLTKYIDKYKLG